MSKLYHSDCFGPAHFFHFAVLYLIKAELVQRIFHVIDLVLFKFLIKNRGFPQEHESSRDGRMIFLTNQNCISFVIF